MCYFKAFFYLVEMKYLVKMLVYKHVSMSLVLK